MHARLRRCAAIGVLGLLVASCVNPFRPAQPEPPSGDAVREDFSSPSAVLRTISAALAAGNPGADAYLNAFADSLVPGDRAYRAFYEPLVKAQHQQASQAVPEPWDRRLEQVLFLDLTRLSVNFQMSWNPDNFSPNDDTTGVDTVQMHRQYVLLASSAGGTRVDTIAIGYTDLSMLSNAGRWAITRWNDRLDQAVTNANPTLDPVQLSMSARRLDSQTR